MYLTNDVQISKLGFRLSCVDLTEVASSVGFLNVVEV